MLESEVAKRKPGFARDPKNSRVNTAEVRRHRDRARLQEMAENAAIAAAGAAAKALTPRDVSDEVQQLIASSAEQVSKIIATNGPAVIQALVDRAVNHADTNAAALLTKFIVSPKTKIRLDVPQGATLAEFADSVIAQTVAGKLSTEDGEKFLKLASIHQELQINSQLTEKLASLQRQLVDARDRKLIEVDTVLTRPVIKFEDMVR
jgi:hypothetical protein